MEKELYDSLSVEDRSRYFESLTDEQIDEIYKLKNEEYMGEFHDSLISYAEYKELNRVHYGNINCFSANCRRKAEFPVYALDGTEYGMCEECARLKTDYFTKLFSDRGKFYLSRRRYDVH